MSDQQKETLSALFDGETNEFETRRLLAELDDDARAQWQRYQLIRDSANHSLNDSHFSMDISANVAAQIADESVVMPEANKQHVNKEPWFKPVIGFAAAASVAFVTVLGVQNLQPASDNITTGFVADGNVSASQLSISSSLGLNQVSGSSSVLLAREIESINAQKTRDEARLKYYLQQHAQHASFNNGRGLLPMARLVKEEY